MAKLINILLRKTDPDFPWGFTLGALPPALHSIQITSVDKGSLASEHLEPGDRVLEIEGIDTTLLSNSEVESLLASPSHKLELLIMKKTKPGQKTYYEPGPTTKTIKTKETVSSTSEAMEETKILNENLIEESKIITSEGKLHKQIMETTESSENEQRTDTFWTCPPSDLVKTEKKMTKNEEAVECKNQTNGGYVSESVIFKNLNNYRDEARKIDPREEKRRFWESCRKGDQPRRFKWGDSVKPNLVSSPGRSEGSTESLHSKSPSKPVPIPKMERSKSCDPSDTQSGFNPFYETYSSFKNTTSVSPTNPFYREFDKFDYDESSAIFSSSLDEKKLKSVQTSCPPNDRKFFYEYDNSNYRNYESGAHSNVQKQDARSQHFGKTTDEQKTPKDTEIPRENCADVLSPSQASPLTTNVISKKEFETKCKFFENVTSIPGGVVNKNARDIVEEKLQDRGQVISSQSPTSPLLIQSKTSPPLDTNEAHTLHSLRKPSDFINKRINTGAVCNQGGQEMRVESNPTTEMETVASQLVDNFKAVSSGLATSPNSTQPLNFYVGRVNDDAVSSTDFFRDAVSCSGENNSEKSQGESNSFSPKNDGMFKQEDTGPVNRQSELPTVDRGMGLIDSSSYQKERFFHQFNTKEARDQLTTGLNAPYQHQRLAPRRGGSLERDFYEKRTFKESSYRKISRGSQSPYENVVSTSSKEYQEESGTGKDRDGRPRTPDEFYDNNSELPVKVSRTKSPQDISFKTFRDIQSRLGTLLGAKPIDVGFDHFKRHMELAERDSVDEAFHKLAIQEGIVDSTTGNGIPCTPQQQRPPSSGPPPTLPPSALAAMQPQIAIPVFPPGGSFPSQLTPPPPPPPPVITPVVTPPVEANFPPPPPLPQAVVPGSNPSSPSGAVPPPPPPPPPAATPTTCKAASVSPQEEPVPQSNGFSRGQPLAFLQDIQNRPQLKSVGPINQNKFPNDFVAEIPVHAPLRAVQHPPRSSYDPANNNSQIPIQLKSVGPKPPPITTPAPPFIPQPKSPEHQPIYQVETQQNPPQLAPRPYQQVSPPSAPDPNHTTPIVPVTSTPTPQMQAPNVNKAPAPWMTTRQTSREPPPPWTTKQSQAEDVAASPQIQPQPTSQYTTNGAAPAVTRVIPIQIEGQEAPPPQIQIPVPQPPPPHQNPYFAVQTPQMYIPPQQRHPFPHHQQFMPPQIPPYYQEQSLSPHPQHPSSPQTFGQQVHPPTQATGRTHIIPIQIEGASEERQTQSPSSFAQRSNSSDAPDGLRRPLQTQTSWTGAPTQSRSFRVLQKITGSEDEPTGPFPAPSSETFLVNRVVPQQQGRLDESEY